MPENIDKDEDTDMLLRSAGAAVRGRRNARFICHKKKLSFHSLAKKHLVCEVKLVANSGARKACASKNPTHGEFRFVVQL